jgi:Kef-type K+ transport system membrane component KefB
MSSESLLSSTLLQLIIMIAAVRSMNRVFKTLGQPGVIGKTVAGPRQHGLTDRPVRGAMAVTSAAVNDAVGRVLPGIVAMYASSNIPVTFVLETIRPATARGLVIRVVLRPLANRFAKMFPVDDNTVPANPMTPLIGSRFLSTRPSPERSCIFKAIILLAPTTVAGDHQTCRY